ncbi:TolC family protein [Taibaiella soli]|uniref:TolC family protein n=1 Tax=Taibaiella soli TaxID=1649169 RepID=A0A2W2ATG5_9BACT|nr:TolC family protein [Taibaiella soli]PZF70998.1 TolC family protein [Taibaiella soli]
MRFFVTAVTLCLITALGSNTAFAQKDDNWTLQRCVQYAVENNISIQQNVLNERLARLSLQQSQLSQIPSASASGSYGRSWGRSIDPTTNQFVNGDYDFIGVGGNANLLMFGWFQTRNTIAKNKFSALAAKADLDQLKDDVSLNVATGFLRALQAQEQINVNQKQVELSEAQLDQTRKFADAGRVPELNVAQLESQLATDSSNLISAIADYNASILDLKALLNLDFAVPFSITPPDISVADQIHLTEMDPEQIYAVASDHFGSIKSSQYKVNAAEKGLAASKGALYPSISSSLQLQSNWASTYKELGGITITGEQPTGSYVYDGTTRNPVLQPTYIANYNNVGLGQQLSNNFRQILSFNLNVPIFNAWQSRYAVRQAQVNVVSKQLDQYQAKLTLKQNVYKAYNDARNSVSKYYAAKHAADAAERAYDFAQKRYDLGLTNTIEYLTTQNNQYRADASLLSAKYDLIFRLKVIDYYLGKELKL